MWEQFAIGQGTKLLLCHLCVHLCQQFPILLEVRLLVHLADKLHIDGFHLDLIFRVLKDI